MKKWMILAVAGSALFPASGPAREKGTQANVQLDWIRHYSGGEGNHESTALAVDALGSIYVAGKHDQAGRLGDQFDFLLIKYDPVGAEQWAVTYGGSNPDEPMAMAIDPSGYPVIHGRTQASYYDYLTVKYNPSGQRQWLGVYDGPSKTNDLGKGVAVDASGNIYVTGWSKGVNHPTVGSDFDFATVKYSPAGVPQWAARYDGSLRSGNVQIITDDRGHFIAVDGSGNVFVTGTSSNDICTIKYDAQGTEKWVKRYTGPGNSEDVPAGIGLDASGNVYVAGKTEGYGAGQDIVAIKYSASGTELWVSRYSDAGDDYPNDMAVDAAGNLHACGASRVSSSYSIVTVKFSADGARSWFALYDTSGSYGNSGKAVALDAAGNVYVAGYRQMSSSSYDYITLKYDSGGRPRWAVPYDNRGFEWANDVVVDGNGGVVVTGYEVGIGGIGNTITTLRYSQNSEAVDGHFHAGPDRPLLAQNYPNPFNPATLIRYALPKSGHVSLRVYDLTGREVAVLEDGYRGQGNYSVKFDGADLPGGVYLYRFQTGDYTETRKLLRVK